MQVNVSFIQVNFTSHFNFLGADNWNQFWLGSETM